MELRKFLIDTIEPKYNDGNYGNGYQETPTNHMILKRYLVLSDTAKNALDRFMTEDAGTLVETLDVGTDAFVIDIKEDDG